MEPRRSLPLLALVATLGAIQGHAQGSYTVRGDVPHVHTHHASRLPARPAAKLAPLDMSRLGARRRRRLRNQAARAKQGAL